MKIEQYQVDLCAHYQLLFSFLVIYFVLFVKVNEVDFIVEKWFKETRVLMFFITLVTMVTIRIYECGIFK